MGYRVEKELTIPRHLLDAPVPSEIKQLYGFDPATPQEDLLLATVLLRAARYGGKWNVAAAALGNEPGEEQVVGSMWCEPGTRRDEVLSVADAWVRESEGAIWVPGPAFELSIQDAVYAQYAVNGLILVRGSL